MLTFLLLSYANKGKSNQFKISAALDSISDDELKSLFPKESSRVVLVENAEYKEKVDIEVNDERNKFLSSKAWAWTGYIFVLCCAVASIVYRVMGENELGSLCTTGLCLMVAIYFIAYMILKRKY